MAPLLRHGVARSARWARDVEAVTRSLSSLGKINALLVTEEFYPKGMLSIAAARRLGIPTVGVQHMLLTDDHTIYTPPAACIGDSPVPDYFAAYGKNAQRVLGEVGAFPADRIWTVGCHRTDVSVPILPQESATQGQGSTAMAEKIAVEFFSTDSIAKAA